MPEANKTWEEFKIHFSRAYHELKETMETAQSAGFHGANNAYHEETQQFGKRGCGRQEDNGEFDSISQFFNATVGLDQ